MSYITRNLQQNITIWTVTTDGYGGYTYGSPTTVKGRWEEKAEMFRQLTGEETVSKAIAYLHTDVAVGSYLYLGTSTDATPPATAHQVAAAAKIPNLRNLDYLRKLWM